MSSEITVDGGSWQSEVSWSLFCEGLDSPMFDPKLAGGGMLPVGCYVVQAAPMVFGATAPTRVAAAGNVANGVDTSGGICLSYEGGKLAVLAYNLQVR